MHLAVIRLLPLDIRVLEYRLSVVAKDLAHEGTSPFFGDQHVTSGAVDTVLVLKHQRYDDSCGRLFLTAQQRSQPAGTHEDVVIHADRKSCRGELQADVACLGAVQEPWLKDQCRRRPISLAEPGFELIGRPSEHYN